MCRGSIRQSVLVIEQVSVLNCGRTASFQQTGAAFAYRPQPPYSGFNRQLMGFLILDVEAHKNLPLVDCHFHRSTEQYHSRLRVLSMKPVWMLASRLVGVGRASWLVGWRRLDVVLTVHPQTLDNFKGVLLMLVRVGVRRFKERR